MEYNPNNPLFICPSVLTVEHFSDIANAYLPVDTGIEIECNVPENWKKEWLDDIPNIVENLSSETELRVRVKPGLVGFNTIFELCKHLNEKNYILTNSAIHYHVDISGFESDIKNLLEIDKGETKKWVDSQILLWDHVKSFVGNSHVFFKKKNTIEIRCGKMTFSYPEMIKDIVLSHYIVKYVKQRSVNAELIDFVERNNTINNLMITASELIARRFVPLNFNF